MINLKTKGNEPKSDSCLILKLSMLCLSKLAYFLNLTLTKHAKNKKITTKQS